MNERRLVELIFRRGRIARVDLAEATDMTGASVTRLVAGLEKWVSSSKRLKERRTGSAKAIVNAAKERVPCSWRLFIPRQNCRCYGGS